MDRFSLYDLCVVDGKQRIDLCNEIIHNFTPTQFTYHRVVQDEIGAADLISFREYGTEDMNWVIVLVNEIENPFTDIPEGRLLKIPILEDVFALRTKVLPAQVVEEPDVAPASKDVPLVDKTRFIME